MRAARISGFGGPEVFAVTDIPTPGQSAALPNALAISFRIIALF